MRAVSLGTHTESTSGLILLQFEPVLLSCGWRKREMELFSSSQKEIKKCVLFMEKLMVHVLKSR